MKIDRENASRYAIVQAYVSGRDLVGFVEEAQQKVREALPLPPGYRLVWGGQFENQRRAANRLSIVVPIALGMIFVVLFATLRSIRQAALIIGNIPFALVGGVLALWISGEYLSVPASVGFIALLGIAVLNGLVLVSHFNELLAAGLPLERAVFEGALRRLRPVMMTASIAALGLVPLLFATVRDPKSRGRSPSSSSAVSSPRQRSLSYFFQLSFARSARAAMRGAERKDHCNGPIPLQVDTRRSAAGGRARHRTDARA